ncbi:MAG: hypothetical protein H7Z76_16090 [Methylotenera sp.]|nr:hypothetical protein [Flavobacterium sp.]
MKATEARKLTESKEITTLVIIENIKRQADNGMSFILNQKLPDKVKMELIGLGYSIRDKEDNLGITNTIIEW